MSILFSTKFCLVVLHSSVILLESVAMLLFVKWRFSNSTVSWYFSVRGEVILLPLPLFWGVSLLIHASFSMNKIDNICLVRDNPWPPFLFLLVRLSPNSLVGSLSSRLLGPFDLVLLVFEHLIFWHNKLFQLLGTAGGALLLLLSGHPTSPSLPYLLSELGTTATERPSHPSWRAPIAPPLHLLPEVPFDVYPPRCVRFVCCLFCPTSMKPLNWQWCACFPHYWVHSMSSINTCRRKWLNACTPPFWAFIKLFQISCWIVYSWHWGESGYMELTRIRLEGVYCYFTSSGFPAFGFRWWCGTVCTNSASQVTLSARRLQRQWKHLWCGASFPSFSEQKLWLF